MFLEIAVLCSTGIGIYYYRQLYYCFFYNRPDIVLVERMARRAVIVDIRLTIRDIAE